MSIITAHRFISLALAALGVIIYVFYESSDIAHSLPGYPDTDDSSDSRKAIALFLVSLFFISSFVMDVRTRVLERKINTPVQTEFLSAIEGKEVIDIDVKTEDTSGNPKIIEVLSVTYRDKDGKHTFIFKDIDKDTTLGEEIDVENSEDGSYHVMLEEDKQIIIYAPAPPEGPVLISQ